MSISVIIPCYNQAHFLPDAIDSVLRQTFADTQIVVVNDGSKDNTSSVAKRYGKRIILVEQDNAGLSAARNAGLRIAEAEYIFFLDADDLIEEKSLQRLHISAASDPCCISMMGYRFLTPESMPNPVYSYLPPDDLCALPLLFHSNIAPVHCALVHRELIKKAGEFDTSLRACEDWDFWSRLALKGARLCAVPYVGAVYRIGSTMSTDTVRMHSAVNYVIAKHCCLVFDDESLGRLWGVTVLDHALARLRAKVGQISSIDSYRFLLQSFAKLSELVDKKVARDFDAPWYVSRNLYFNTSLDNALRHFTDFCGLAIQYQAPARCLKGFASAIRDRRDFKVPTVYDPRTFDTEKPPIGVGYYGVSHSQGVLD